MLGFARHLGQVVHDERRAPVGRLDDLVARLGGPAPPVTALIVHHHRLGHHVRVPWSQVAVFDGDEILVRDEHDVAPVLAPDELRLARDVLDTQVVDVDGRRVVRAGDVLLAPHEHGLQVAGVELGLRPVLHRLGLRRLALRLPVVVLPWDELVLASPHAHRLQMQVDREQIERLGPGGLAHVRHRRRYAPLHHRRRAPS